MKNSNSKSNLCIKKIAFVAVVIVVGILVASSLYSAAGTRATAVGKSGLPESFSRLAEAVSPAVVNIRTVKTIAGGGPVLRQFKQPPFGKNYPFDDFFKRFFGDDQQREYKQRSLGSGFIIDKEGYIVTNNHVIEGADQIKVKLSNEIEYDAEIIGRDPSTDLALIKIKSDRQYSVVTFGDSNDLKVGEWVVAIGSPFGLEHTVTAGIVSAKGRVIGSGPYDDFIQTDASINPGNSGGPLINMKGEVVGINTAILAEGQGIGFAIPVNIAKTVIEQLKAHGEVVRGWLGVGIQDITEEISDYYGIKGVKGVLVTKVFTGDPADKAGIRPKDIILEVNGQKIETSRELTRVIAAIPSGDTASIKILRDGMEKTFKVKIAERIDASIPSRRASSGREYEFGLRVANLTPEIGRRFGIAETEGVVVTYVQSGSQGEDAGLMVGDVIKEINHRTIKTVDAYRSEIHKITKGETVHIFIKRANAGFLVIKLTK